MFNKVKPFLSLFFPYLFFAFVSILMLVFAKLFSQETLIGHPQFGLDPKYFDDLYSIAQSSPSYKYFFVADMLFTISIVIIIRALYNNTKAREDIWPNKGFFKRTFVILALASVFFDFWENYIYLWGCKGNFHSVEIGKSIAIAAMIGMFVYYFTVAKILPNWKKISDVLSSSLLSILILVIIGFGLTFMPQGASLIVHLLDETDSFLILNLIISFVLVNILVLFISHFPIYINFAINKTEKRDDNGKVDSRVKWYLDNTIGGLGVITYHYEGETSTWKKYMRHSLGVLTYAVWFYVIVKAFDLYHLTHVDAFSATLIVTVGILAIYAFLFHKSNDTYLLFMDSFYNKRENVGKYFTSITRWSNTYLFSLISTIVYAFAYFIIIYTYHIGWSYQGLILILILMLMNTWTYILFRLTKGMWKYVWGDDTLLNKLKTSDHQNDKIYGVNDLSNMPSINQGTNWLDWLKKMLVKINSSVFYVKSLRGLGIFALSILLVSFILMGIGKVTMMSAVIILLAFIINVYALITVSLKHILFYKNFRPDTHFVFKNSLVLSLEKAENFSKVFLPVSFAIVLLLAIGSQVLRSKDNIYRLDFVKKGNVITLKDYEKNLKEHIDSMKAKKMIKIASFGGGLKSNLWNLLILNEIKKKSKNNSAVLDKCISLSGVSGGAVGLSNFLALDYFYREDTSKLDSIIQDIGELNILAIDMSGILINDFVRNHFSQFTKKGENRKDRAYFAMREYIGLVSEIKTNRLVLEQSQQTLWRDMYEKHGYLPALIINTASTGLKPGVAFSLDMGDKIIFPGYMVLSDDKMDLRYYDAVSTSNRFPVMSPAAQVEQKGFFLDGGYFENSGLLTTKYFCDVLKKDSVLNDVQLLTINIQNSKGGYIRKFIDSFDIQIDSIDFTTNAKAIISGITNIDKLPNVLAKAQKWYGDKDNQFCSVFMPHWITVGDIEKTIGGRIKLTKYIHKQIVLNNQKITDALRESKIDYERTGIVEPPLARTLSSPAVKYEQAMIKYHIDCRKEIERIVDFIDE